MTTIRWMIRCVATIALLLTAFAPHTASGNHYILCDIDHKCVVVEIPDGTNATAVQSGSASDFGVSQIYSSEDGSVQYIQILQFTADNSSLAGRTLTATDGADKQSRVQFPATLPRLPNGPVLVATRSFAALGHVKPDIVVPDGFFPIRNGTLMLDGQRWRGGPMHYDRLPTDGINALYPNVEGDPYARDLVDTAFAVNNAGEFHIFGPADKLTGLYWDVEDPGWGIAVEHQGENMLALWATHDDAGDPTWFAMQVGRWDLYSREYALSTFGGPNVYPGTIYRTEGTPFGGFATPAPTPEPIGNTSFIFLPNERVMGFIVEMSHAGRRLQFSNYAFPAVLGSPIPHCVDGAPTASDTNVQGLWWNSSEPGFGLHLSQHADVIFALWFTYDDRGRPTWLSLTANRTSAMTFEGSIHRTRGRPYSGSRSDPVMVTHDNIGTARLTFRDASHGTFSYALGPAAGEKTIERQMLASTPAHCG
jgi:hypothetical protein